MEFSPKDIPNTPIESLLDSLNLGVMRDNISQQINGIISTQQNFLSIVLEKFNTIETNTEDGEVLREIKYDVIDFCKGLIQEIVEHYDLFYMDDIGQSLEVINVLSILYNFFILRGKELITTFFTEYIKVNKYQLIESLRDEEDSPHSSDDITTLSNKKKNVSNDIVWIVSHIDTVVDFICSAGTSPEEFIQLVNDGDFYVAKMKEYFEDGTLGGDFTRQFIYDFIDESNSEYCTDIRNDIRLEIIQLTGRIN